MMDRRILTLRALATRALTPEDQVTLPTVGISDVLALAGTVLPPSDVWQNLLLVGRLVHGVPSKPRAVEPVIGGAI
jgi:hypothetical protein